MTEDRCERVAKAAFPRNWTVGGVSYVQDNCIVDFVNEDVVPDCDSMCENNFGYDSDEYDNCVKECEGSIRNQVAGSVEFNLSSRQVKEATLPTPCYALWNEGDEGGIPDIEGKVALELKRRFKNYGCGVPGLDWIHPHELVGAAEAEEEPVDVCFIHVASSGRHFTQGGQPTERCRVGELVRATGHLERGQTKLGGRYR